MTRPVGTRRLVTGGCEPGEDLSSRLLPARLPVALVLQAAVVDRRRCALPTGSTVVLGQLAMPAEGGELDTPQRLRTAPPLALPGFSAGAPRGRTIACTHTPCWNSGVPAQRR